MLQLQGLQRQALATHTPHPADEVGLGGGQAAGQVRQLPLPVGQAGQGIEGGGEKLQIQSGQRGFHGIAPFSRHWFSLH